MQLTIELCVGGPHHQRRFIMPQRLALWRTVEHYEQLAKKADSAEAERLRETADLLRIQVEHYERTGNLIDLPV